MANQTQRKSMARLEVCITLETKALLQKAADLEGRTLTDFVVASARVEACRVIQQHQMLKLSIEDSEAFVETLLNPPRPNEALKSSARKYKQVLSTQ